MIKKVAFTLILVLALFLSSCGAAPADQNTTTDNNSAGQNAPNNDNSGTANNAAVNDDQPEPTPEPTAEPIEPPYDAPPAEPQPVEIPTTDGRLLEGLYYPSKLPNAPVVVLMHWAGGTMADWAEIAPWLQNRQDELAVQPGGKGVSGLLLQTSQPYLDPTWFPLLPEEISFAVLVFNFGGFGNSPYGGTKDSFVDDAYSAMVFAGQQEGVDPNKISALGASIGADGVVDACYMLNMKQTDMSCVGAFSISPGNYLTDEYTYTEAAAVIDEDGFPVWCLGAENDYAAPDLCLSLTGTHAQTFIYAGGEHGMDLVTPDLTPTRPQINQNALDLAMNWLDEVYGTSMVDD